MHGRKNIKLNGVSEVQRKCTVRHKTLSQTTMYYMFPFIRLTIRHLYHESLKNVISCGMWTYVFLN